MSAHPFQSWGRSTRNEPDPDPVPEPKPSPLADPERDDTPQDADARVPDDSPEDRAEKAEDAPTPDVDKTEDKKPKAKQKSVWARARKVKKELHSLVNDAREENEVVLGKVAKAAYREFDHENFISEESKNHYR